MRPKAGLVLQPGRVSDALGLTKLFHKMNFAALLGVHEAELARYDPRHGIITHHSITPYYCRKDHEGGSYLSAGVITALFDEVSTCAAIVQDRNHRPGLSVTLEVQVLKHVGAGSSVKLTTWADKVGKTLAFLSMRLEDENTGDLVAVGRHVKFLPLGLAWDAAMTPTLYPLTKHLIHQQARSLVDKAMAAAAAADKKAGVDGSVPLPSLYSAFPLTMEEASGGDASFRVEHRHCNGFGKMHGGALAVLAEDVAIKQANAKINNDSGSSSSSRPPPRTRHMSISYYNALSRGDISLQASAALTSPSTAPGAAATPPSALGSMLDVRVGSTLCNQATFLWA